MSEAGHSKLMTTSEEFPAAIPPGEVIVSALAFVRRNRGTILACLAITSVVSIIYLLTATPRFTAKAALYIDAPKVRVMDTERPIESTIDSTTIESQVEILQSDAIAAAVVTKQGLANDADFLAEGRSVLGSVLNFVNEVLSPSTTRSVLGPIQRAMRIVQDNLRVSRSGVSAVIKVDYVDSDPNRAARIANAVADAYVDSRIDARRRIAERASSWLRTNLRELQQKSAAAESELQEFRAKNDISAQAKLNDLQATANTYRKLYDSSLQRYAETVQQESLQLTDADVVSAALPPPLKSHPKPIIVLPIGIFAGLCLGLGLALWRELSDQTFRTTDQIRENLKTDCLAVPETITTPYWRRHFSLSSFYRRRSPQNIESIGVFAHVLSSPVSQFAESLRALKVNCDCQMTQGESKIVGFTSALEKEGKSTIAANFALLLSRAGRKTLLVDADFHTSALSRVLAPDATKGFCEAVLGRATPEEAIRRYSNCSLHFLPGVPQPQPFEAAEFLGSEACRAFLEKLRQQYDYIVVDLPPLAPVVDVRAGGAVLDGLILVVQWGKTPIPTVQRALESAQSVQCKLLGAVLNNVDLRTMRRYGQRQQESEFYGSRASIA
jgi:capsular exopolysaccharide synthesis family protein